MGSGKCMHFGVFLALLAPFGLINLAIKTRYLSLSGGRNSIDGAKVQIVRRTYKYKNQVLLSNKICFCV
jgi:hypothetical protein